MPETPKAAQLPFRLSGIAVYAMTAVAVWLAWETVKVPLIERGPPALAVRLAPGSPEVLRRAAEAELAANRLENARALAEESLVRAPFNARALRVEGLAIARLKTDLDPDEILTLAGNWSLRDDPAHGWLVENRLRKGDYGSAFAHADTLARRRQDLYPSLFQLFTTAATHDKRALPALARLLANHPPWRGAYFNHLYGLEDGAPLLAALTVTLEKTSGRVSDQELGGIYSAWANQGRWPAVAFLRNELQRPATSEPLQNGAFSTSIDQEFYPFGWLIATRPGLSVSQVEDDIRDGNEALRIEYDGFGTGFIAQQLMLLKPGRYVFAGEERLETIVPETRLQWRIICVGDQSTPVVYRPRVATVGDRKWRRFKVEFELPARNCETQGLALAGEPGDRRRTTIAWFDNLTILGSVVSEAGRRPASNP